MEKKFELARIEGNVQVESVTVFKNDLDVFLRSLGGNFALTVTADAESTHVLILKTQLQEYKNITEVLQQEVKRAIDQSAMDDKAFLKLSDIAQEATTQLKQCSANNDRIAKELAKERLKVLKLEKENAMLLAGVRGKFKPNYLQRKWKQLVKWFRSTVGQ